MTTRHLRRRKNNTRQSDSVCVEANKWNTNCRAFEITTICCFFVLALAGSTKREERAIKAGLPLIA